MDFPIIDIYGEGSCLRNMIGKLCYLYIIEKCKFDL